ncbi:hypothetical protein HHI36_023761 [Cryptolaemus montrouzieri]|uniref:Uncharacterized protein n=1 Tax=Cryptolaemus montrouzieri TaxID=559131 RepID=A0ABD2PL56_9CUCU
MADLCGSCNESVKNKYCIECKECSKWHHTQCEGITEQELKKIENLHLAMKVSNEKYDKLYQKLVTQEAKNQTLQNKVNDLKREVQALELSNNEVEQNSSENNVVIHGIPVIELEENISETVIIIIETLNLNGEAETKKAVRIHRREVGSFTPVKVEFSQYTGKLAFLWAAKENKLSSQMLGFEENERILAVDELTKYNIEL